MKMWKKYVGYDQWDQSSAGQETYFPGPLDNSNLFTGQGRGGGGSDSGGGGGGGGIDSGGRVALIVEEGGRGGGGSDSGGGWREALIE